MDATSVQSSIESGIVIEDDPDKSVSLPSTAHPEPSKLFNQNQVNPPEQNLEEVKEKVKEVSQLKAEALPKNCTFIAPLKILQASQFESQSIDQFVSEKYNELDEVRQLLSSVLEENQNKFIDEQRSRQGFKQVIESLNKPSLIYGDLVFLYEDYLLNQHNSKSQVIGVYLPVCIYYQDSGINFFVSLDPLNDEESLKFSTFQLESYLVQKNESKFFSNSNKSIKSELLSGQSRSLAFGSIVDEIKEGTPIIVKGKMERIVGRKDGKELSGENGAFISKYDPRYALYQTEKKSCVVYEGPKFNRLLCFSHIYKLK